MKITFAELHDALNDLDDFARMEASIEPIGAHLAMEMGLNELENLISSIKTELTGSLSETMSDSDRIDSIKRVLALLA
jgi:hypothetical protein